MKHAVVYVPGLGDSRVRGQAWAVRTWRLYGTHPELFQMNWADGEDFQPKITRLLKRIDELVKNGYTVSLVGSSAGASAVVNAFAERKDALSGVAIICGKIGHPEKVSDRLYAQNPAFRQSMARLDKSLQKLDKQDRRRILSIRPIVDFTVPVSDMKVEHARMRRIPTFFHAPSIAFAITLGALQFIRFLKKLPS